MNQTTFRRVRLRLRSPLCIAQRPTAPGQPIQTRALISGTALRGGLANAWLAGRRLDQPGDLTPTEAAEFRWLFLSGEIQFGACRLALPNLRTDVVPLTAYTAKHGGGWHNDEPPGSGVEDVLSKLLKGDEISPELDRHGGRFAATPHHILRYQSAEAKKRLIARTAIDEVRGAARDSQLYTFEALESGQEFEGQIQGNLAAINVLMQSGALGHDVTLGLGQGRSRGLGAVQIVDIGEAVPPEDRRAMALADVVRFNSMLSRDDAAPTWIVPITLESDIILRDRYLLPSSDADPEQTLSRYQKLPMSLVGQMRLVRLGVLQSTAWLGGWDELRRMPRPAQLAVTAGSVWCFAVPRALVSDAVDWWLQAERDGLGERRIEGYGRVLLCHPLHLTEEAQ